MASRIILDPEALLAQAGEMQSLTAEYESLFSKVTGTLNDTNNNWSELLAHNFAGKISSAQQSFASITELLSSGAAAAKNSATTMQSVDADVSSMSEDELGELKENQTAVSSGLMGAFKEQGLDSTKIDESTGTVQMDNNVLFAWDKADLSEEGKAYLDQFLAAYVPVISSAIEDGKVSTIVVEGYTDSAGDEAYNLKLSEERAKTVADYIKAGYPELANAIEVVGNGANNLILDGEGKEDAAASRRVEVRYVLKTE